MRAVEIGIDTLTGQVASPGELRTLSPTEVCLGSFLSFPL
jgi:hypothetical protein